VEWGSQADEAVKLKPLLYLFHLYGVHVEVVILELCFGGLFCLYQTLHF
jgi:hypothetical protein